MQNPHQAILIAALVLAFQAPHALSGALTNGSPTFNEGVQAYNHRQYSQALSKFSELERLGQGSELVHYYMALSYQGLNQISMAKAEYSFVSARARDAGLRANAQKALASIDKWSNHRLYEGNGNFFARDGRLSARPRPFVKFGNATLGVGSGSRGGSSAADADCPPSG